MIADLRIDDQEKLMDKEYILNFARTLIDKIRMKIYDNHIYCERWAAENTPHTYGVSLIAFLTTSGLQLHTTNDTLFLDVFSCAPYTSEEVLAHIHANFKVREVVRAQMTLRS